MKIFFAFVIMLFILNPLLAQDENILLKQADNFEKQFDEANALSIYEKILSGDAANIKVIVKCAELNCSTGEKQKDKEDKAVYFNAAKSFADKALALDSNNAEANYAQSLVYGKLTEIETENKKIAADVKEIYVFAVKSLALNPAAAKPNYVLGKWYLEVYNLPWIKKTAVKALYGALPNADIDSAIFYLEKCRSLDIYFTPAYYDLAKAYQTKNQPEKEIEVLQRLVKLPNRVADDSAFKSKGQAMLDQLQ